ncbi:MAG: GntG family PLP-dependent aldolase [Planctomycetota bacterium]|nr:GntG family PLP-dependent aldolase [Planctomycetota bacterium]
MSRTKAAPPRIDLRSDTVTKPCPGMLAAMSLAEVGDDVICSDPTVENLQAKIAGLLGKEAAVFMPSGSMANQIGVRLHCQPGDEFLCESECHIYMYEQGAFAQLSGLVPKLLPGTSGVLTPEQFLRAINPVDDHALRSALVTLENTHNRGGGVVQPMDSVSEICTWAHANGLKTHLDGARLFNAVVASGYSAEELASDFDTVSVCFSKGLGAPVGSALVGNGEAMVKARRIRKLFGGGMRQVGFLAAAALYALENNIDSLRQDHDWAKQLATSAVRRDGLFVDREPETNIVLVRVDPELGTPAVLCEALEKKGIGSFPFGADRIRLVTHRDLTQGQIDEACDVMERVEF